MVLSRDHVLVAGTLELVADVTDDDVEAGVAGMDVGGDALGELLSALEFSCSLDMFSTICEGRDEGGLPRRRP